MVSILITAAAYEAIRSVFPDTTDAPLDGGGMIKIWLERDTLDSLKALRRQGESTSEVILRLTDEEHE